MTGRPRQRYTVYIFRAADGSALYVGCTSDLAQRIRTHDLGQEWYHQVASITCEHFTDKATAQLRERYLIAALRPPHGTANAPHGSPPAGMDACRFYRWCGNESTEVDRDGRGICTYHADGGAVALRYRKAQ